MNRKLAEAVASINQRMAPGTLRRGSESQGQEAFSTGIPSLDAVTGGIPRGRIVEIFGEASSGKSALAAQIARQAGAALYMDADCGLAYSAGLHVMRPALLEDALGAVRIAAKAFDAVVIDTVTALQTKAESSMDIGDFYVAGGNSSASVLSRALPVLVPILLENACTLILVNQLRNLPGVFYGRQDRPTGGRAIRHYAAMRLEMRTVSPVKHCGETTGQQVNVSVQKNKYGGLFGEACMVLSYGEGWRETA